MPDPNYTKADIHSDFSIDSGTWSGYRAEVTGLYNDYPNSELDAHTSREYNRKISNLGQDDSLYLNPYDAGFGYRGDGYNFFDILGNAAAAYSLRSIDPTKDPSVVEVRRSSDNATSTFTASQVTDGTLTSWVNTAYNIYISDFSSDVDGWLAYLGTLTPNVDSIGGRDDCIRFVQGGGNGYHRLYKKLLNDDNTYRISAEVYLPSANSQIDEIKVTNGGSDFSNVVGSTSTTSTDQWVTISFTANRRGSTQQDRRIDFNAVSGGSLSYTGNGTDTFYVRNIQIDQLTTDGHVTTWYDQSIGSTNHATQTTSSKQPKIVDSGTLVTEGGKPALDFDGTDDYFQLTSNVFADNLEVAIVSHIVESTSSTFQRLLDISNGANNELMVLKSKISDGNSLIAKCLSTDPNTDAASLGQNLINDQNLTYVASDVVASSYFGSVDGVVSTISDLTGVGSGDLTRSTIGIRSDLNNGTCSNGTFQEIVVFNTDQSANRVQMENSIMNYYNIS